MGNGLFRPETWVTVSNRTDYRSVRHGAWTTCRQAGNCIPDAFTTEIGGEVYLKAGSVIAMGAVTGGEIRGTVLTPGQRGPSLIGKVGVDQHVQEDMRVRLTGSVYHTKKALSSTLYGRDRRPLQPG